MRSMKDRHAADSNIASNADNLTPLVCTPATNNMP